jgi:heme-degrading monooxygenase HmoA
MSFELAQYNIAKNRWPLSDPRMAGFVDHLDEINHLGDRSPGFVWRLQDDSGDATAIRLYDDPEIIVNMSVWESPDALREFAYRSGHAEHFRRRREWFEPMDGPILVLWWVPEGERPTALEGKARLDRLTAEGPTEHAFTFARRFDRPAAA